MIKKPVLFIIMLSIIACSRSPYYKGDLGGVPVDLPTNLVHLLEYNKNAKGKSDYQAKIKSFGFYIRHTDNTIFDEKDRKLKRIYKKERHMPKSPWVSVGINSGDEYYGAGGIHRIGDGTINPGRQLHPVYMYKKLPKKEFGLEVYAPPGIDPNTGKSYRQDLDAEDVFIQRNDKGEITTFIKCSNRNLTNYTVRPVINPPCTHYFDLEPDMALDVYASYSRHNLDNWQQIERIVKQRILDFRTTTN